MNDRNKDNPGVAIHPPILFGGSFVASILLNLVVPLDLLTGELLVWKGPLTGTLIGFGIMLAIVCIRIFRAAGTNVPTNRPVLALVTDGPWRFSRNPIYVALVSLYLGLSFALNSLWCIVLLIPALVILNVGVISREERYLETKFGTEYTDYKTRVRRWF